MSFIPQQIEPKRIDLATLASLVGEDSSKLALDTPLPREKNPIACEIARHLLPIEQATDSLILEVRTELREIVRISYRMDQHRTKN